MCLCIITYILCITAITLYNRSDSPHHVTIIIIIIIIITKSDHIYIYEYLRFTSIQVSISGCLVLNGKAISE